MSKDPHFLGLENMYLAAPINDFYRPSIEVADSEAKIEIDVSERLFHAAGAVHGSVYFKMLDDAAFFAANSLEREVFVLTTSFTTYLTRPVSSGRQSKTFTAVAMASLALGIGDLQRRRSAWRARRRCAIHAHRTPR